MGAARNIVVVLSDDHAQWALPSYGNRELRTRALDQLVASGAVMANAFTPVPVCSPARASFLTGLFPSQHGLHDFIMSRPEFDRRDWLVGLPTLPELLTASGYQSAFVGKWHLGRDERPQHGFERWFSLDGSYPIFHEAENGYSDQGRRVRRRGTTTPIFDEAVSFLRSRNRDRPFFLLVCPYATHSPWADQPARLVAEYADASFADIRKSSAASPASIVNSELPDDSPEERRKAKVHYYAAVSAIDEGVGRLLDELEADGSIRETLIVYTSDHGLCLGQHGVFGKGNGTRPQNFLEESIRIPMILSAPGLIRPGSRPEQMVDHTDLFRTILDIAGQPVTDGDYPGRSFLGLLAGRGEADWRDVQFAEYGNLRMARSARHKLLLDTWTSGVRLYDLSEDPDEARDIAGSPEAAPIVGTLRQKLEDFFARYERPDRSGRLVGTAETFNRVQAWLPFPGDLRGRAPSPGATNR